MNALKVSASQPGISRRRVLDSMKPSLSAPAKYGEVWKSNALETVKISSGFSFSSTVINSSCRKSLNENVSFHGHFPKIKAVAISIICNISARLLSRRRNLLEMPTISPLARRLTTWQRDLTDRTFSQECDRAMELTWLPSRSHSSRRTSAWWP